eukprot:6465690-Amphidinium_carterae.1
MDPALDQLDWHPIHFRAGRNQPPGHMVKQRTQQGCLPHAGQAPHPRPEAVWWQWHRHNGRNASRILPEWIHKYGKQLCAASGAE